MPNFYFDTETTGFSPRLDKIVTIQYQEVDQYTGAPVGKLTILKEWESNEKSILEDFIRLSGITGAYPWSFVPVGYNLTFDLRFLQARLLKHGFVSAVELIERPHIDLRPIGILMNRGQFAGSGLDKLTGKPHDGKVIPEWYAAGRYEEIVNYVETEAKEFTKFCRHCYTELPHVLTRFKQNGHDVSYLGSQVPNDHITTV